VNWVTDLECREYRLYIDKPTHVNAWFFKLLLLTAANYDIDVMRNQQPHFNYLLLFIISLERHGPKKLHNNTRKYRQTKVYIDSYTRKYKTEPQQNLLQSHLC